MFYLALSLNGPALRSFRRRLPFQLAERLHFCVRHLPFNSLLETPDHVFIFLKADPIICIGCTGIRYPGSPCLFSPRDLRWLKLKVSISKTLSFSRFFMDRIHSYTIETGSLESTTGCAGQRHDGLFQLSGRGLQRPLSIA